MDAGNYGLWAISGSEIPGWPPLDIYPYLIDLFLYLLFLIIYNIYAFEKNKPIAKVVSKFSVQM